MRHKPRWMGALLGLAVLIGISTTVLGTAPPEPIPIIDQIKIGLVPDAAQPPLQLIDMTPARVTIVQPADIITSDVSQLKLTRIASANTTASAPDNPNAALRPQKASCYGTDPATIVGQSTLLVAATTASAATNEGGALGALLATTIATGS